MGAVWRLISAGKRNEKDGYGGCARAAAATSVPELLILKPSSLGDIIHALQVATTIKAQRPDVRISWVVREIFAPIVRASTAVDQTYVFERKGGTKGFLRLTRELRKVKFDYAFDMQGLLRTGLLMSRVHAKHKVGRTDADQAKLAPIALARQQRLGRLIDRLGELRRVGEGAMISGMAGVTAESLLRILMAAAENCNRVARGEEPLDVVRARDAGARHRPTSPERKAMTSPQERRGLIPERS